MNRTYRRLLIEGLYGRLARYARGTEAQRTFLIAELTRVLSCVEVE